MEQSIREPIRNRAFTQSGHSLFEDIKPPLTELGAKVEASRCLECGRKYAQAPCIEACPVGIDVPGFITAIYDGKVSDAAEKIFSENILGASCARVCPVETLCEGACVLHSEGRKPVEIARLQRYATEKALSANYKINQAEESRNKKVAVIGAGPAGLACAAEMASLGYQVTVYDKNEDFGGLVRYAIAPYRINREPLPAEVQRIADMGVTFKMGTNISTQEHLKQIEETCDAIFLGIGLGQDVQLSYPGETLKGVWESLEFIRAIKTGHPPVVGQKVAVIGGGNTAIDVAIEAARMGARNVTIYYRRSEAEMPAYDHEIVEARNEGVSFQFLTNPLSFSGEGRLQFMECQYMKLGQSDRSGRPRPEAIPGTEFQVPVDMVIKAIGQQKRTDFLQWIDKLELDHGLIRINKHTGQTTNPKYFAGGDALNGGATVVEAVRDGKTAAKAINVYLDGGSL